MSGPLTHYDPVQTREAFFERIVQQHARLLYRVAHGVLRNPEDAEDAVSDAMLKLLRTGAWQTITNERAFLARAVWHSALDRLGARLPIEHGDPGILQLTDDSPSPEESAAYEEGRTLLHALIDRLPGELRDPLLFSAVGELNSREIGEILQLPEGTVRTRLMRARQQLRQQYELFQGKIRDPEIAARGSSR